MEVGDNYGSYLAVVYPDSRENNGTNSTNGVRPVIKLKYIVINSSYFAMGRTKNNEQNNRNGNLDRRI